MQWTAEEIRRAREHRGLSQVELARLLSAAQPDNTTSPRSVTAWENGESRPSGRNRAALDRVLGRNPDSPTLADFTDLELIAELARRMGITDRTLPKGDLRLPDRNTTRHKKTDTGN